MTLDEFYEEQAQPAKEPTSSTSRPFPRHVFQSYINGKVEYTTITEDGRIVIVKDEDQYDDYSGYYA